MKRRIDTLKYYFIAKTLTMTIKKLLFLTAMVLFIASCKKSQIPKTDNIYAYKSYIYGTTAGEVSIADPIQINFASDILDFVDSKPIENNILEISPKTAGVLFMKNKRTLVFKPSKNLRPGTEYTIKVQLHKLLANVPFTHKTYQFRFKTITPDFSINTPKLQSYSKKWQYVEGEIRASDMLLLEDAKQLISAEQEGTSLNIKFITKNKSAKYFDFIIDSIRRKEDDSEIKISWTGKSIGVKTQGEKTMRIPGKNNFSVLNVEVFQSPDQYVQVNFSDPLKKSQNFNGLMDIHGVKKLRYAVEGNLLKVYPDRRLVGNLKVAVFQGIKSKDGYKLKNEWSELVAFEQLKPAIRLLNNGVILPDSQNLKFNFEAVNLRKVEVRIIKIFANNVLQFLQSNRLNNSHRQNIRPVGRRIAKKTMTLLANDALSNGKWKAYAIDLSTMIKADPGALYRVELSMRKADAIYKCEQANVDTDEDQYYEDDYYYTDTYTENASKDDEEREEQYWDNVIYSYQNKYYPWRDRENPCKEAYYASEENVISSNVLGSNLGVIVKMGTNKSYHFTVSNILSTEPVSNASVQLFNFQQQEIGNSQTNINGFTSIDTDVFAAFAIVSQGNNKTYLKLEDGQALSLSKFDVSGKKLQKGLKGYLYGERGVWRPGDTLHLTFILNDKANPLPKNHPVKMMVSDPHGAVAFQKILYASVNGFYKFQVPTLANSATGNWKAVVNVGGAKFPKNLKIETIKPNRLKININFDKDVLVAGAPINGLVEVKWLHGAIAKNLKTEVAVKFKSFQKPFKKYSNYIFNDPTREFVSEDLIVFEGKLDVSGEAKLNKKVTLNSEAPGMLQAAFLTKTYESGGDFSMDVITKKFAPYRSFVGIQAPKTKRYGSYDTDKNILFDILSLKADGTAFTQKNLVVDVYQIKWNWWWNRSYENLSSYQGSRYHKPFKQFKISTKSNGKTSFKLNIPDSEGGRYLIRISDPENGHATGITTYFYKNWWKRPTSSDPESAKMLLFSADKKTYNVGEEAVINFPSSINGRALISLENGTEVIQSFWKKTEKGETQVRIPITAAMAPNVYVNISLLQEHAQTANDLPLRLYGIIPLMVEDPTTRIEPVLMMPNELKPSESFTVKVKEKNGKRMSYTIAVVDEGLLDLTRFKTPNIWDQFYQKEALGVKTWDMFDDVIGAFGGSLNQIFAIGGDDALSGAKNKKANRFKPVVTYLGPFTLTKGKTASHRIQMDNYIGSVRTMVVAGDNSNAAYGSTEKTTPVRKALMVLASLPRKLSPGEKVRLPVTVFAMDKKVKNVRVQLKLSDGIRIVGESTKQMSFTEPEEKMVFFDLEVTQAKGLQTIEVLVRGNGERASYAVEMDVLNPNPISSKLHSIDLNGKTSKTIEFETFGLKGTNKALVEFSSIPPMNFSKRMNYLIQYPHGCIEQTTSSVFPQLFLETIFDLTVDKKQEIQHNVQQGIDRLNRFQLSNGGMSYWIGQRDVNDWGTTYAGHFMIAAEKKGYVLPLTFMNKWIKYQQKAARNWRSGSSYQYADLAQAYRLYTLALAGSPDLSAMNRLRENRQLSNPAKWRLAAAYALASQQEAAQRLVNSANLNFTLKKRDYYTYGSVNRNRAMALETMVLIKNSGYKELAKDLAKDLSSDKWMSTQTTAYSLLAMATMVVENGGADFAVEYQLNDKKTIALTSSKTLLQRELMIGKGLNTLKINNTGSSIVFVNVINSGKLALGKELAEERGLKVNVKYKDTKGNVLDVSQLSQGTNFVAMVTIQNVRSRVVEDIALTEYFPSGWEILNTRFTGFSNISSSKADFTDIRDDHVNFYFDLGPKKSKTFNVQLNASYLGNYYLFGVQAEAMYDNDYFTRTQGKWIQVVK